MKSRNGHGESDRVRAHTARAWNERIDEQTRQKLLYFAGRQDGIPRRIEELDREWDVERWLETNASTLALAGLALGVTVDRKWFLVPGVVLSFLLVHAVRGWCPPLPLMRRMGI